MYFKLSAVFPSKDEHHDVHSSRVRLKTEHEKELEGRLHDALAKVKLFQRACQTAHDLHANHSSAIKRLHSILEKHEEHKHHAEALKQLPHKFNWLRDPKGATSRKQKLATWAREIKGAVEQQAALAARAPPRSKL